MGSYKEIKGNLLDLFDKGEFDIIAHGANCFCTMGAGIAKQIKDKYPSTYYADLYDLRQSWEKLGSFSESLNESIFNLYTQYKPGPNADLTAIRMSLKQLSLYLSPSNLKIGLPLIGCGIGGLKWEDVKPIIQEELKDFEVIIVHYEKTGNTETVQQ